MGSGPPSSWHTEAPFDPGLNGDPLVSLSEIEPIEPKFVEYPLLQEAMFHLVTGKPGVGKGALCARWIARCTNGEMYGDPRRALWLSSEEDAARDLRPRLDVAGGDITKVALIPDDFRLPRDVSWLHERIRQEGKVGLVVIDPLSNHIQHTNSSVEEEVREAIQPLSQLAATLGIVMLGIRHVSTKEGRGNFLSRILGSTGFVGIARAVLGVAQDYDGTVHVRALKGNRVPTAEAGRRFRLEGASYRDWASTVVRVSDEGESHLDFDSLVSMVNRQAVGAGSEQARQTILDTLRANHGLMESYTLDAAVAAEAGVVAKTVRNLRSELHDRGWIAYFPDDSGERRVWMVSLTNAAPTSLEEPLTNPLVQDKLQEQRARAYTRRAVAPEEEKALHMASARDVQLPDAGEQVPETLQEVAGGSSQLPITPLEVSGTSLPCPTCESTNVGPFSGRCLDCGSFVHDPTL